MFRRILHSAERTIERAVESPSGADVIAALVRFSGASGGAIQAVRGGIVHAGGLPSRWDSGRLIARVARLEQLIEELTLRLDERVE